MKTDYKTIEELENSVTPRARIALLNIAEGMNHTQSAIKAGYSKKGASALISRMLKNNNVQALLRLYRHQVTAGRVFTRQRKRERLYDIGMIGEDNDALRAIDLDNKMMGHYEPEQLNLSGDIDRILAAIREKKD